MTSEATRAGIALDDAQRMKLLRGAWLRIDAPSGTTVTVTPGSAMAPDADVTWGTAQTYTVGTSRKVDFLVQGPFIALKVSSVGGDIWRMRSMDLDVQPTGIY
jgi:hypothetical protein